MILFILLLSVLLIYIIKSVNNILTLLIKIRKDETIVGKPNEFERNYLLIKGLY